MDPISLMAGKASSDLAMVLPNSKAECMNLLLLMIELAIHGLFVDFLKSLVSPSAVCLFQQMQYPSQSQTQAFLSPSDTRTETYKTTQLY